MRSEHTRVSSGVQMMERERENQCSLEKSNMTRSELTFAFAFLDLLCVVDFAFVVGAKGSYQMWRSTLAT
jgi:hypothetical protein